MAFSLPICAGVTHGHTDAVTAAINVLFHIRCMALLLVMVLFTEVRDFPKSKAYAQIHTSRLVESEKLMPLFSCVSGIRARSADHRTNRGLAAFRAGGCDGLLI